MQRDAGRFVVRGAYVDLGYNSLNEHWVPGASASPDAPPPYVLSTAEPASVFSMRMHPMVNNAAIGLHNAAWYKLTNFYDTWSFHYEYDGINQDRDQLTDEGTDGIDENQEDGVDDMGERETSPPYAVPLRAIQISVRGLEPDSQAIRQISIKHAFAPR